MQDGSIVHNQPGITRDRTYRLASWSGYNFQVVDTGGIIFDDKEDIFAKHIQYQAMIALKEACAVIFVCDGQEGITSLDENLARWLRRKVKLPTYLAVNKCESEKLGRIQAIPFERLGLGKPHMVSGIHGLGIADLLDEITQKNMKKITSVMQENTTNVAIIGRPNVGKSSLLNR